MSGFKAPSLAERQNAATIAKKAALEKFRANSAANNPAVAERQATRQASGIVRQARAVERKAAKVARDVAIAEQAVAAQKLAEQAARDAAAQAERDVAERADRQIALQADQKAARDTRYAARKARKK